MTITYDQQTIGIISTFEKLTKASVKNCFKGDSILFIVKEGDMGKAIGKNGKTIQQLTNLLKKPIRVVEYSPDPIQFIRNLTKMTNSKIYKSSEGVIIIEPATSKDKGILLGRDRKNLKQLQEIVKHHHNIEVRVQ